MNYKHLLYFWTVARLGGVVKAGEHLHVADLQHLGGRAPRQKLWVAGHVINQTIKNRRRIRQ